jgi:hypothetical protein
MVPITDSYRLFGVYKPALLYEPDGYEHWAILHGASAASWSAVELDGGEALTIPVDGSWKIAALSPQEIEARYEIRWPRDEIGQPVRGAELWPDPWWDRRNRNPVFAAVLSLGREHGLPFDQELSFIACDVARLCPEAKIPRYRDEPVFMGCEIADLVTEGVDPVHALRYAVMSQVDGRSFWWYREFKPVLSPQQVWRQSGWAGASRFLKRTVSELQKTMLPGSR